MGRPKRKAAVRPKSTRNAKRPPAAAAAAAVARKKHKLTELANQMDEENRTRCADWLATQSTAAGGPVHQPLDDDERPKMHDEFPNDSGSQSEAEQPIDISVREIFFFFRIFT